MSFAVLHVGWHLAMRVTSFEPQNGLDAASSRPVSAQCGAYLVITRRPRAQHPSVTCSAKELTADLE